MYQKLQWEKSAGIATIQMNNPPLHVMNRQLIAELSDLYTKIEEDPEVSVVILTSTGKKAFMAGADIKEFPAWLGNKEMKMEVQKTHNLLNQIEALPKPTIAVLNGITLGGGCELALACDLRIAEEHAQIGLPEIKLGIFPGGGGTQRLPRLIGMAKAKELMFTGESISAEKAQLYGLVNQVVPSGEGKLAAKQLAGKIANYSSRALSLMKEAIHHGFQQDLANGLQQELSFFYQVFQTDDAKEGIQAFIEKRKPQFKNK